MVQFLTTEQGHRGGGHNNVVVFITRLESDFRACILMPPRTGEVRISEFHRLPKAVSLAKAAAKRHALELAVLLDDDEGVRWRKEWQPLFHKVH